MLKTAMLVSALALSAPALAQEQKPAGRTPATTSPAKPATVPTDTATDAAAQETPDTAAQDVPATAAPATDPAPAEQAGALPQTAPAVPAAEPAAPARTAAAPVTGASQIAQVVDTEFPTYDKNADTSLDKAEFGAWMVALKTASDPATKAGDPATVKWIDGAFASADADKSKTVSKAELTSYLSQGAE